MTKDEQKQIIRALRDLAADFRRLDDDRSRHYRWAINDAINVVSNMVTND